MIPTVNIYLVSYFSEPIVEKVIRRIKEVTIYPHRLIVGDNLSMHSTSIRKKLKELVDEKLIDKLFLYDDNYLSSVPKHMITNDDTSDIIIITDYDAYIENITDPCWLTDYINKFESDKDVLMIQFYASNGNLSTNGVPFPRTNNDFCVSWKKTGEKCKANGHFLALRRTVLDAYFKRYPDKPTVDGNLILFIDELRRKEKIDYKKLRYDKSSVLNLSTKLCKTDNEYKNIRRKLVAGGNYNNKNLLSLYNIKNFEVYRK